MSQTLLYNKEITNSRFEFSFKFPLKNPFIYLSKKNKSYLLILMTF